MSSERPGEEAPKGAQEREPREFLSFLQTSTNNTKVIGCGFAFLSIIVLSVVLMAVFVLQALPPLINAQLERVGLEQVVGGG